MWTGLPLFGFDCWFFKQSEDEELDPEVKREITGQMSFIRPIPVWADYLTENFDGFGRWPIFGRLHYAIVDD